MTAVTSHVCAFVLMSEASGADRRTDGGVDRHDRTPDDRAVQSITSTSPAPAAIVQWSDASHATTATQRPSTQAPTVNCYSLLQSYELTLCDRTQPT